MQYQQSNPSAIFKRVPECDEDNMRQCFPYPDEFKYSAEIGVAEAKEHEISDPKEILLHVMRKYKGHMPPHYVQDAIIKP